MNDEISIQQGFENASRLAVAELYDAAFGAKLSSAIPDRATRLLVLKEAFDPSYSFVALLKGEVVGIAGFKTAQGSLTDGISIRALFHILGLMGTARAALVLSLFERKVTAGQLLMDGIAVSPKMRGRGVGTQLLHHLIRYAQSQGYTSLRLDVIDTNPAARRLYERVGFAPVTTEHFAYLRWLLGFGSATQMEYNLADED